MSLPLHRWLSVSLAGLLSLLVVACTSPSAGALTAPLAQGSPPGETAVASGEAVREELETSENRSESLASFLNKLARAVRTAERDRIPESFTDPALMSPLPLPSSTRPGPAPWLERRPWAAKGDGPRLRDGRGILAEWETFLDHFSSMDGVTLKVLRATFEEEAGGPGVTGEAEIRLILVGRDGDGKREWVRAPAKIRVERTGSGDWGIREFAIDGFESMVATRDLFSEVGEPAGVGFSLPPLGHLNSRPFSFYWHGAAADDIDGDGDIDLLVTADDRNFLYINNGMGHFEESSEEAGLEKTSLEGGAGATAPLFVDIDNDGDRDVFLSRWGKQKLFENLLVPDGKLRFREISEESGVAVRTNGLSAVAGDVNGDGLPDIYVCGYGRFDSPEAGLTAFTRSENGGRNLLFINQGDRRFVESAEALGVDDRRWSNSAVFADLDGDGDQDLYVANDWGENQHYINDGSRFREAGPEAGLSKPGFGMGVSLGDYDNDGDLDLHATYMSSTAGARILGQVGDHPLVKKDREDLQAMLEGNRLFQHNGDGTFRDITSTAGPFPGGWAWGGGFLDIDNDGWLDLHTPNGLWSGKRTDDT